MVAVVLASALCGVPGCEPALRPGDLVGAATGHMDAAADAITDAIMDVPGSDAAMDVTGSDAVTDAFDAGTGDAAPLSCPTGMALIAGGTFNMGAMDLDMTFMNAAPHVVRLSPYCMDVTEVTVSAYCRAMGCTGTPATMYPVCNWTPAGGVVSGHEAHPMNCVTWNQARTYCQSLGNDLPTEAQWEFAARGGPLERDYPWSMGAPGDQLCWSGGSAGTRNGTCPVGTFSPAGDSPNGLQDMAGNVWEWTRDCYEVYTSTASLLMDPVVDISSCPYRVYRGGSWLYTMATAVDVRAAYRYRDRPTLQDGDVGFRCVRNF